MQELCFSSLYSAEHACRDSTYVCVLYMTSHNTHSKKIVAFPYKPLLLRKSDLFAGMRLQNCGFYSKAFIYNTLRYADTLRPINLITTEVSHKRILSNVHSPSNVQAKSDENASTTSRTKEPVGKKSPK